MLLEGMSVMMGGPEANGDSGQPCHRLDNAYELRRTKEAAKLLVPRREVSNADRAALLVGQNGRDDRGVAQILRLEVDHAVEHDVGKSLLFIACNKPAEDRIAVEARGAPPHEARRGSDERSGAAVADHRKIKPVISHEVASARFRLIFSSQWRTSLGCSK